ncbi:MAG: hypothetical protein ACI9VR_005450, partial [Cognaticolwellia sp.]
MQFAKLKDYFEEHEHGFVLRTPVTWHRKRGLGFLILVPFLAVVCGGMCGGGIYDESGQRSSDAWIIALLVGIPSLLIAVVGAVAGLIRLFRANSLSERSEVRIDLQRRVIFSKSEGEFPLSQVSGLEMVQPSRLTQWRAIRAKVSTETADSENPYQARSVKSVTLLNDIEAVNGPEAVQLMERVGERIGKPVYAAPEMSQTPQSNDRTA